MGLKGKCSPSELSNYSLLVIILLLMYNSKELMGFFSIRSSFIVCEGLFIRYEHTLSTPGCGKKLGPVLK